MQALQAANHSLPPWALLLFASPDWCGGCTDVSSLMIFVTIKLIVVYGSEMQECGGKQNKGSRLMDREVRGI